jgi:Trp operon repressor
MQHITQATTLLVCVVAFILSYGAIAGLTGSVLYPLIVDAPIVTGGLLALYYTMHGERARYARLLVVSFTLLSIALNTAHSSHAGWLRGVDALPPIALALVFEALLQFVQYTMQHDEARQALTDLERQANERRATLATLQATIDEHTRKADELHATLATLRKEKRTEERATMGNLALLAKANETRQAAANERREKVFELLQQGMKQAHIAQQLNVGLATVKRDVKSLNGRAHHLSESEAT